MLGVTLDCYFKEFLIEKYIIFGRKVMFSEVGYSFLVKFVGYIFVESFSKKFKSKNVIISSCSIDVYFL